MRGIRPPKSLVLQEWALIVLVLGVVAVIFLIGCFEDSASMALLRLYLNKFMTHF